MHWPRQLWARIVYPYEQTPFVKRVDAGKQAATAMRSHKASYVHRWKSMAAVAACNWCPTAAEGCTCREGVSRSPNGGQYASEGVLTTL